MLLGASQARAQQPPAPRDTVKRVEIPIPASPLDSVLARDTTKVDSTTARRRRLAADTVKSPLAHAELPSQVGDKWHWNNEQLRASGAVTLADLIARVPGATEFRANWIPAPQYVAYNGDVGRVRLFFDGVELDPIDPRGPGVHDLALAPLWQIEDVTIERAAGELRVHLRSWRVDRTIPITQTDITSGSENTNLYRGFFGKRLHNGGAIQLAAQQYSSLSPRTGGDGPSLQVFGRVGWARKQWSVDATWNRASIDRSGTTRFPQFPTEAVLRSVPTYKGALSSAYARVAWGDPDAKAAPWAQLIAATQSMAENHKESSVTGLTTGTAVKDTVDSTSARVQYVLSAGASRWGLRASVSARMRMVNQTHRETRIVQTPHVSAAKDTTYSTDTLDVPVGETRAELSPSVRLGYQRGWLSASAFAEARGSDSTRRADLSVRLTPWRWLDVEGAYGSYRPKSEATGGPAFTAYRLELGTRLAGHHLSAGAISRGLTMVQAPVALDSTLVRVLTGESRGIVAGVNGPVYEALSYDISGIRWDGAGAYRPQMEVRSRLFIETSWLSRFPRNNLHILAEATHEHRTPVFFPDATGGVGKSTGPIDILGARLEIRIASGTAFIQFRNLTGRVYDTAPGYVMPRQQQMYGLRWEFWN